MKKACILFVLKNDEKFLIENIETIDKLKENFDLVFIVRQSNDRTEEILKTNNYLHLCMPYDSGYFEALTIGFEYVEKYKYNAIVEFGEVKSIELSEINYLYDVFKNNNQPIIFASRKIKSKRYKNKKIMNYLPKFSISFAIFKKVYDPYTKFKIYNRESAKIIQKHFENKLKPCDFILLLYIQRGNFIEVGIKYSIDKNEKIRKKIDRFLINFNTVVYTIFLTPYIKYSKKVKKIRKVANKR